MTPLGLRPRAGLSRSKTRDDREASLRAGARRWLGALSVGILAVYGLFFLLFWNRSGPKDGDQFLVFHTLQYWNSSMFGVAKQWTPLMCSGLSMAGEPQVPFMSLSMALSYVLGPLDGVKSALVIYLTIGWIGAFLYAGLWLKTKQQRVLAASLFVGNGFFFCRLAFGHFDLIPFLILPLVLWALHGVTDSQKRAFSLGTLRLILLPLLMGALLALAIDGSPVAIVHLVLWLALYAVILALTVRSATPVVLLSLAIACASLLDAGYLWPMLESQSEFPRLSPDRFTSALSLLWFAVLPARGKVLPANGNGHELSVFIGPILGYCLWRYRHWLWASLPVSMRRPLLVVSLVSIVLGMGSLKVLHIPSWLSPFDLLRPLPGFRSIGVTGRYWGFLALPLSLLSAKALYRFASEFGDTWRVHVWLGFVLILQAGFQAETLTTLWLHSPPYRFVPAGTRFQYGPESIEYVALPENQFQGQLMTPTRGVSNCYDMDDFNRTDGAPGTSLVTHVTEDQTALHRAPRVEAGFATWSRIRLTMDCALSDESGSCAIPFPDRTEVTLSQAYHAGWHAAGCETRPSPQGHLIVSCPASRMREGPIDLHFDDPISDAGARVSTASWRIWLCMAGSLMLLWLLVGIRALHGLKVGAKMNVSSANEPVPEPPPSQGPQMPLPPNRALLANIHLDS
jgi:hypothetical protein